MLRITRHGLAGALLLAGSVGTALVGACAESKGALILAVNTDMKAPKDVNAVSVSISTNGVIKHSFIGRVTPQGEVQLPATLAIVEPEDKSASIRIRVMAFQERKARVLRDVRTTVPTGGRTALLRIPLNFVNDASAVGQELPAMILPDPIPGTGGGGGASSGGGLGTPADFDFFGAFSPPCPDTQTQTIIDGECQDSFIDPETLPDFDTAEVGDSTNPGSCFDVPTCFASEVPLTLDRNTCTVQLNGANPARINLALVTPDTGACVRPGECYVPLDRGKGGWTEQNGAVQLPPFVCKLLSSKDLRLATSTEVCAAKEDSNPICAPPPGAIVDPPVSACADSKTAPVSAPAGMVLRLTQVNLGDLDVATDLPASNAWRKIGFDLDGLCTTKTEMNVCARQAGADSSKQEDGEGGIDNAWGRSVLGLLLGIQLTPSKTASAGGSFLELDAAGNGALHISIAQDRMAVWSIPLIDVRLDRTVNNEIVAGTLAAKIPVESLVNGVTKIAGQLSAQLCGGSTLDTLKATIRQAVDLPLEGLNRQGVPCDAVSIGITFTGTLVAAATIPAPAPDPCLALECPRKAAIDASTLPAKPAYRAPGSCTAADIDSFVAYVEANPAATPAMLKTLGVPVALCQDCVFGPEGDPTWAPLVELATGKLLVNRGGCIDAATGNGACGQAYQRLYACTLQACQDCAAAQAGTCPDLAIQPGGACRAAFDTSVAVCGGPALTAAETACKRRDLFEGPVTAQCGTFP